VCRQRDAVPIRLDPIRPDTDFKRDVYDLASLRERVCEWLFCVWKVVLSQSDPLNSGAHLNIDETPHGPPVRPASGLTLLNIITKVIQKT
jgi:hypothetical protein